MPQFSTRYIYLFALGLCLVCSTLLSVAAVGLRDRQETNKQLDKKKSVLLACRLLGPTDDDSPARIAELFKNIEPRIIDTTTGAYVEGVNADEFDEDSVPMIPAPPNPAGISEIPEQLRVFLVNHEGELDMVVLPIFGKGLWGTLYGFLAVDADLNTVRGITYYSHKETPGLGGEVDNPKWKNRWPGRQIYSDDGEVVLQVIKGSAGDIANDPHHVDGLSGATITSRGVSNMIKFWLGEDGLAPYLATLKNEIEA